MSISPPLRNIWEYFDPPDKPKAYLLVILPLILAQICQRLFHIVDIRFISPLGEQVLLVHNVQYTFIVFGQFLGIAGTTTALVLWNREENKGKQASLFYILNLLTILVSISFAIIVYFFKTSILNHFKIPSHMFELGETYLSLGLVNMVLQSVFICLDGQLIAAGKQRLAMILMMNILLLNIIGNYLSTTYFTNTKDIILGIGSTTSSVLLISILIAYFVLKRSFEDSKKANLKETIKIWKSEVGIVIIRSLSPMVFAYQTAYIINGGNFLINYNSILHIAYIACLPLSAGIQIAVREASKESKASHNHLPKWWANFFFLALIPSIGLLIFGAITPSTILKTFYNLSIDQNVSNYASLFFCACIIGQIGHSFSIILRVNKLNHLVTRNFLFSEIFVQLGLLQLLIFLRIATTISLGLISILYTFSYLALNIYFIKKTKNIRYE